MKFHLLFLFSQKNASVNVAKSKLRGLPLGNQGTQTFTFPHLSLILRRQPDISFIICDPGHD